MSLQPVSLQILISWLRLWWCGQLVAHWTGLEFVWIPKWQNGFQVLSNKVKILLQYISASSWELKQRWPAFVSFHGALHCRVPGPSHEAELHQKWICRRLLFNGRGVVLCFSMKKLVSPQLNFRSIFMVGPLVKWKPSLTVSSDRALTSSSLRRIETIGGFVYPTRARSPTILIGIQKFFRPTQNLPVGNLPVPASRASEECIVQSHHHRRSSGLVGPAFLMFPLDI